MTGDALRAAVRAAGLDAEEPAGTELVAASEAEYRMQPQATVELLASALARLHAVPVPAGDPGSESSMPTLGLAALAERARAALADGRLAAPRGTPYAHVDDARLVAVLGERAVELGGRERGAVTHGSAGLDTLRCRGGVAVGFVGWDAVAHADPHRDLAAAAASVVTSFGPMLVPVLLDAYAAATSTRVDPLLLDAHALAHELLG